MRAKLRGPCQLPLESEVSQSSHRIFQNQEKGKNDVSKTSGGTWLPWEVTASKAGWQEWELHGENLKVVEEKESQEKFLSDNLYCMYSWLMSH